MKTPAQSHKTAMRRSALSAPARYLSEHGLINGRALDYGCGRGFDAKALGLEKYDPYYEPTPPIGKYDTILCIYVLNVLPIEWQDEILAKLRQLLAPSGKAYIAVRRDFFTVGYTSIGTYQRKVELAIPFEASHIVVEKSNRFCIYGVKALWSHLRGRP
jgi:SAM-dependent methyltransferase